MSPDWMITRLTVVLLAIFATIYFFLLVIFLPFQLAPFADPTYNLIFHFIVVPLVFASPWLGLIYYSRYRLANTIHLMHDSTSTVPLRWRVFYGTNAAFVLVFFILPLTAPPLAVVGGLYVAGHLFYTVGLGKMGGGKLAAVVAIIVAIALCILPTFVMLEFLPQYINVWTAIVESWNTFWIVVIYGVAQCLVNSLSFGAPIYFIFFAAREYERGVFETTYTKTPTRWIRFGELLLFTLFLYLYLPDIPTMFGTLDFLDLSILFTMYINWISMGIVVIMILVRRILGVKDSSTMGGASNIFIIGLFLVVELFFKTRLIETVVIWLAFLLFAGVAFVNFARASSREMY
ncbi:MAG: hypothetical protein JSW61_14760 [Candidatus Thorarchaeota archaeon]|nr:MAG: hypothetical protein JSW61_14760 [Candidatus Thorarchaeota archaeon]